MSIMKKELKDENAKVVPSTFEVEIEKLTRQFCKEVVGDGGMLEESLKSRTKYYDKKEEPLGITDAKKILKELLAQASKEQLTFSSRFKTSMIQGNLHQEYYRKIEEIDNLAIEANRKFQMMEAAEEKYSVSKLQYENIYGKTFVEIPVDEENEKRNSFWNNLKNSRNYKSFFRKKGVRMNGENGEEEKEES